MLAFWQKKLEERQSAPRRSDYRYDFDRGRAYKQLELGEIEKNVAASAQAKLEEVLLHLARIALREMNTTNLMFSGGVALNCSANEKLLRETPAENLYLFPAGGDAGAALGAALELAHRLGVASKASFASPYLGPAFTNASIAKTLTEYSIPYTECDEPAQLAAERLAAGEIIGWFQGRMEVGPRALGHRSIFANPSTLSARDRVNQYAKRRERWRPLAPMLARKTPFRF